jgi:hypothetical protein
MMLSNGQALVGVHIPTLVPLRETAKLPLDQRRRAGVLPRPRPSPGALALLLQVAGSRWKARDGFAGGKELAALDEHQVRSWTSWHRWTILALLAHAFLSVLASQAAASHPADEQLIPLTRHEIRRLLTGLSGNWPHQRHSCTGEVLSVVFAVRPDDEVPAVRADPPSPGGKIPGQRNHIVV